MKIALLFLTRKELNHPRIWQQMLESTEGQFNLYIHSKEPLEDPFFQKYRISTIVPTSYLVHGRAWQVLIQEALKDEDNVKFVYLSESCMPLYPLKDLYHYLIRDPHSFMRYSDPWWPRDSEREVVEIPIEHRWGNAEWIILTRRHAQIIAQDREVLELTSRHINSDHEAYPSSLFSIKGCLDEIFYRLITYANFTAPSEVHPYHFCDYNSVEVQYIESAKRAGCLFARKFTPEFPSEVLLQIASERLMLAPSAILSDSPVLDETLEQKITLLQAQEEMSQANACALLPMLLNAGLFEVVYEIGTGLGLNMERLLQATYLEKAYGVDDYRRGVYQGISFDPEEEDKLYHYVQKRMEFLELNVELLRSSSLEVAQMLPDYSVDVVFFNSEHNHTSMQENLEAWFPKLRKGGILAGYQASTFYPHLQPEIFQFFSDKNLQVHQEIVEPKFWWVELSR
jgi:SAM-dependent methyltransferase